MRAEESRRRLTEYFKKNFKKGYTEESLKWALVNQGYSRTIIDKALEAANKELAEEAPVIKEKPVIKYEVLDENDKPVEIEIKKPWWKRVFGL
ncbi:MAG TPA: hypothetical protein PLT60_02325 [Candidatus Pacearchaeota archaeon]|jgi:SOS response regulatory protein OraA/RecX|nr:hypothetical protein [Candidatus Pacearchaeota archaeon]HOF44218.1 hypothetical protein [Candidatus Pacearchaeota archaeon]HOH04307.1 hypothetical protein [Candidatus Pacearchaeota archaeon]HPX74686.1 hypothetical protein [Candidatus Pacearchaeota archaeon]HQC61286.1 hypothetical protein [Candidatus Pacearchaeota archaeon]